MRSRFMPDAKWRTIATIMMAAQAYGACPAQASAVAGSAPPAHAGWAIHRHDAATLPPLYAPRRDPRDERAVLAADAAQHAPELFAKTTSPQTLDLDWYLPDAGISPPVLLQRIDGGPEIEVAELQPDADGHASYTANATHQGEMLIHRVRWTARDGVARYSASDTSVLETPRAQALDAQFGATRVVTHWSIQPADARFVVALERSEDGGEFAPVTLCGTSRGVPFTYADASVHPSHAYRYRLCWGIGTSGEVAGITAQAPLHGLARGKPDRLTVSWHTSAMLAASSGQGPRGFLGIVQRRLPGAVWRSLSYVCSQPLAAFVGVDSVGYDDLTAVPGQLYEYRLGWADAGDTLYCEAISGTLPRIAASLLAVEPMRFGAKVLWQVTPDDPWYPMRVLRRESTSSVWDTLGTSYSELPGLRAFVDNDRTPGHEYAYRLIWQQSGIVALTPEPVVTAVGRNLRLGPATPNPATEGFAVQFTLSDATPTRFSLFDIHGRERIAQTYVGPGAFTFACPKAALESGVYFMRLENGQRRESERVVIGR